MGIVVAFVGQKGGVGKSTLARALARETAAGGLLVKVADLDVQQGILVNWQRRRLGAGREPTLSVESFRNAGAALGVRDGMIFSYWMAQLVPAAQPWRLLEPQILSCSQQVRVWMILSRPCLPSTSWSR